MKKFIGLIIVLWIVSTVSYNVAGIFPDQKWFSPVMISLSSVSFVLFLISLGYVVYLFVWPKIRNIELPKEAKEINSKFVEVKDVLKKAETDSSNASLLLMDAKVHTTELIKLIQGIVKKSEQMQTEAKLLSSLLSAIYENDKRKMVQIANALTDHHIRDLILTSVKSPRYWESATLVISGQIGVMDKWINGYNSFSDSLMLELSRAKANLFSGETAITLGEVSRPLLSIQGDLAKAATYLEVRSKPGLNHISADVPLLLGGYHE
jgi:hypothetical protein